MPTTEHPRRHRAGRTVATVERAADVLVLFADPGRAPSASPRSPGGWRCRRRPSTGSWPRSGCAAWSTWTSRAGGTPSA
ncbi:hypothetical protein ACFQQB_59195 [Nonomuraea rubra]|uniref:hypothetical protein n=1 Tax=Nonomuraea rubra TaxID=46180 RepID=UPI00360B249B